MYEFLKMEYSFIACFYKLAVQCHTNSIPVQMKTYHSQTKDNNRNYHLNKIYYVRNLWKRNAASDSVTLQNKKK
ncbi:hypothetical protein EG68_01715 [Paragonimus skrjabini miyazakii]|uniref:Uncharacterized protein n=1 Tax=Paragonimus skrjabini miyazakii TaxID=59628 RepID=A0A8S9Z715_9TREM|nr:hypothetical protein EG68_01715 [Paragonimus skrjabini miyazakii]